MNQLIFKLGLFFCIWYEIAAELHLDGDTAFIVGIAAWFGCRFAVRIAAQAIGLLGPNVFGLILQVGLWMLLFWWFAPATIRAQPVIFVLGAVAVLALAGARCRQMFERQCSLHGSSVWRAHSGPVVAGILGLLLVCMMSLRHWGSLWPLVAYALLPGIPFSLGWRQVRSPSPDRPDAKVGNEEAFRDAGLSEER